MKRIVKWDDLNYPLTLVGNKYGKVRVFRVEKNEE